MSDQNPPQDPPQYPGSEPTPGQPEQPAAYPPPPPPSPATPPPAYPASPPAYPTTPPAYPTAPPPAYGQPGQYGQPPAYGQPQADATQYWQPPYPQGAYQSPPENPYVHWGLRVAATLLDSVLLIPFYIAATIGLAMYGDLTLTDDTQNLGLLIGIVAYVLGTAFSIWNQVLRQGRTGSSLGKHWIGIAVISEQTGTPIGGWRTLGRSFVHILDGLSCYVGYLWPLWDDKRQTFADKIMSTIVVKRAPEPVAYPTQPGYPAPPQY